MRNIGYLVLCATVILSASAARAVDQPVAGNPFEVKTVAVVDVKRITDESLAAKTAQKEINDIKDKYLLEIKAEDKKLQDRRKELMDQKKALSEEAFNKKVMEFKDKVDQERVEAAKKQKVIEAAFVKSLELIKAETMKVVSEIAQEKKLDMVIPTSQLLFSKQGLDISDEVLKRLNERLTKVDINVKESDKSDSKPSKSGKK